MALPWDCLPKTPLSFVASGNLPCPVEKRKGPLSSAPPWQDRFDRPNFILIQYFSTMDMADAFLTLDIVQQGDHSLKGGNR